MRIKSFLFRCKNRCHLYFFRKKLAKNNLMIDKTCRGYQYLDLSDCLIDKGCGIPRGCVFTNEIHIGRGTTFGECNFINGPIRIGRYCQFGMNVATFTINHPISFLTTYINQRIFDGELYKNKTIPEKGIVIGDGVWLGHGVIILPEVTIGNGAIIGAGSVVTKDIPAYAIAAGNPAKVIRYRFAENIQKEIEELRWTEMNNIEMKRVKFLFFKDYSNKTSIYE